jgi:hypothetical protein
VAQKRGAESAGVAATEQRSGTGMSGEESLRTTMGGETHTDSAGSNFPINSPSASP